MIFAGTAGTVTVSGTVTPNAGMTFSTTGYTISGGTAIALGGATAAANTITTDSAVTATISTPLSGSNGLTKAGAGILIWTPATRSPVASTSTPARFASIIPAR